MKKNYCSHAPNSSCDYGLTAYELDVKYNGYSGTLDEWLAAIKVNSTQQVIAVDNNTDEIDLTKGGDNFIYIDASKINYRTADEAKYTYDQGVLIIVNAANESNNITEYTLEQRLPTESPGNNSSADLLLYDALSDGNEGYAIGFYSSTPLELDSSIALWIYSNFVDNPNEGSYYDSSMPLSNNLWVNSIINDMWNATNYPDRYSTLSTGLKVFLDKNYKSVDLFYQMSTDDTIWYLNNMREYNKITQSMVYVPIIENILIAETDSQLTESSTTDEILAHYADTLLFGAIYVWDEVTESYYYSETIAQKLGTLVVGIDGADLVFCHVSRNAPFVRNIALKFNADLDNSISASATIHIDCYENRFITLDIDQEINIVDAGSTMITPNAEYNSIITGFEDYGYALRLTLLNTSAINGAKTIYVNKIEGAVPSTVYPYDYYVSDSVIYNCEEYRLVEE